MWQRHGLATAALCVLVLSSAATSGADPSERTSGLDEQRAVYVTAYNGGLALVHDRRRVALNDGMNRIAWRDVSANMDATSALLESVDSPGSVDVLEQNFNFDLLSPQAILEKYVGHDVEVVHDKPVPGEPRRETARLLSTNDGVVLQYRDRIETQLIDSHIVYASLPASLRDRPTLVLDLESRRSGEQDLDLSYLTRGVAWSAEYVGVVAPDERTVSLKGYVTLSNTSGTTYRDTRLQLVAGNVNVSQEPNEGQLRTIARVTTRDQYSTLQEENYFEYHLYTLPRTTTIADNQTKQVSLLTARNVAIHKTLELRGSASYYSNENADLGDKLKVGVYETFTNKGGDLGVPLPGGLVRLYKNDSRGSSLFLGSDRIDHTPRNEDVRLHLGDSFDVTANKKQTDFHALGNCTFDSSYAIVLGNAKDQAVDVLVVEPLPGDWSIISENLRHRKTSSSTATWNVHVPANAHETLTYAAHVNLCF
ncbi:MAG: DUF4139 domain-containing protein [Candidatus Eremiobacteraeota bacterium]|nr:DUF4139 domain-containing protein [Candidatus Eremiobacteraeota bacterium]